jgi:hypothetical protein
MHTKKKMNTEFVDIIGYEGLYQINRNGEVMNILSRTNSKAGKILKLYTLKTGYGKICLWKNGKCKNYLIHRLLGLQFIPNPENKPTIDHIDRNRQNNSLENLRWATYAEQNENTSKSYLIRETSKKQVKKIYNKKYWSWTSIQLEFRKILLD